MSELVKLALDCLHTLNPFRVVREWERGLYYVFGRCWWTLGPGLKLLIPGVCELHRVPVVPEIYLTPLQTVTLRDGSTLTYSASMTVVVTDPAAAYNTLGHYTETVVELSGAVLSEGLADADPDRFDPARGKRDRLLAEFREAINDACRPHGLECTGLRLNNFVRGIRTVRLLLDRAVLGPAAAPVPPP